MVSHLVTLHVHNQELSYFVLTYKYSRQSYALYIQIYQLEPLTLKGGLGVRRDPSVAYMPCKMHVYRRKNCAGLCYRLYWLH